MTVYAYLPPGGPPRGSLEVVTVRSDLYKSARTDLDPTSNRFVPPEKTDFEYFVPQHPYTVKFVVISYTSNWASRDIKIEEGTEFETGVPKKLPRSSKEKPRRVYKTHWGPRRTPHNSKYPI